jgi:hypothetical protein
VAVAIGSGVSLGKGVVVLAGCGETQADRKSDKVKIKMVVSLGFIFSPFL